MSTTEPTFEMPDEAAVALAPGLSPQGEPTLPPPLSSPRYVVRTPWGPVGGVLASLGLVIGAIVGAGMVLGGGLLWAMRSGVVKGPEDLTSGQNLTALTIMLVAMVVFQAALVAGTLAVAGSRSGKIADVLALRPPIGGWLGAAIAVGGFVAFSMALGAAVDAMWPTRALEDMRPFIEIEHSQAWWLALLLMVIGAPASEELLFRGFLLSALANSRLGFVGAAIISSLAWAALHAGYSIQGLGIIFVMGLGLSYILWRTGSLRVTMLCHGLYNGLAFLIALTQVLPQAPGATG